jgi:anaerobic magnesium-protoporphyrin IX monomethyl ester cyclase
LNQRFHNLKRIKRKGMHAEIEFGFDPSRILSPEEIACLKAAKLADVEFPGAVSACGAPPQSPASYSEVGEIQVVLAERAAIAV